MKQTKRLIFLIVIFAATLFIFVADSEGHTFPKLLMLTQPNCPACMAVKNVFDDMQSNYFIEVEEFNVREDILLVFEEAGVPLEKK